MSRQCTAKSKRSGKRCKRAPALGQSVCHYHGAASPQARRSARERLAALVEPAIDALRLAIESEDLAAIVRAATVVLDRTGFHPRQTVEHEGGDGIPSMIRVHLVKPDVHRDAEGEEEPAAQWPPAPRKEPKP